MTQVLNTGKLVIAWGAAIGILFAWFLAPNYVMPLAATSISFSLLPSA